MRAEKENKIFFMTLSLPVFLLKSWVGGGITRDLQTGTPELAQTKEVKPRSLSVSKGHSQDQTPVFLTSGFVLIPPNSLLWLMARFLVLCCCSKTPQPSFSLEPMCGRV